LQFARAYGGKEISTVVASNIVCGPIEAALANGVLAHADETDDSHAPSQSHPGCAVCLPLWPPPSSSASAEQHFLRAVALGYDIGSRVTMTLGGQQFEAASHWSTHSIAPLFRRGRCRELRRQAKCSADALDAELHRASILRPRRLES